MVRAHSLSRKHLEIDSWNVFDLKENEHVYYQIDATNLLYPHEGNASLGGLKFGTVYVGLAPRDALTSSWNFFSATCLVFKFHFIHGGIANTTQM